MMMSVTALAMAMAAQPCGKPVALPHALRGWSRTGSVLDTRHAVSFVPRSGRIETRVTIRKAGIFGIAIDRDGWINVAPADGKPLRMTAENKGPRCSGIRKIVRYRLRPGAYRVTVEKAGDQRMRMLLVRGPAR